MQAVSTFAYHTHRLQAPGDPDGVGGRSEEIEVVQRTPQDEPRHTHLSPAEHDTMTGVSTPAASDHFWSLIDQAREQSGQDLSGFCGALQGLLDAQSTADIAAFDAQLSAHLARSYTWPLWGAAYVMQGGCSDDSFDDFRAWLIAQGQTVFEQVLADPDSLADQNVLLNDDEPELESLMYVASGLHRDRTGQFPPVVPLETTPGTGPTGEAWDEDDLDTLYPKLSAKYD